ncbi:hypothetical protein GIS00_07100 [Nakamurella sp. YIM 132087]|uniref:Mycothiol-dependent maleylpyruvate isomerase metal-binding domain-containing protein n=2 Tax=Nakamurella alba TaxID=2665158 RepID=A0A7K1FJV1_9ACTN|nr:hypothetical protein [Nakamurella alba]
MPVPPGLIDDAVAATREVLGGLIDADWSVPAGDVDWSCARVAAHIADDLFSYAGQIIGGRLDGYLPIEAVVPDDATPEDRLDCIEFCAALLRLAALDTPATARAGHPRGVSDPGGFVAMGAVECVVHTYDIARGLGVDWRPPAGVCAVVLDRLFPGAPAGDPVDVLLYSAGRLPLGDRPRLTSWGWDSTVR